MDVWLQRNIALWQRIMIAPTPLPVLVGIKKDDIIQAFNIEDTKKEISNKVSCIEHIVESKLISFSVVLAFSSFIRGWKENY